MSIKAMNWAMEQQLAGPSAQCVLYVIADCADEKGLAFPSVGYIAEKSRQSRATVQRRLRELEELGVCVRFKRFGTDGRRTSDEIRLAIGRAFVVDLEGHDDGPDEPDSEGATAGAGSGEGPHVEAGVGPQSEAGPVAPVTRPPSQSCDPYNPSDNPESPPKAPLRSSDVEPLKAFQSEHDHDHDQALHEWLQRFRTAYPIPSNRPEMVANRAAGLTIEERAKALAGARGIAAFLVKNPKRSIVDPAKYLGSPALWDEFARFAPAEPPPKVFVAFDSEEWHARTVIAAIAGDPPPSPVASAEGLGLPAAAHLAPPGLALAVFAQSDLAGWVLVHERTPQFFAWTERLAACGRRVSVRRIKVGDDGPEWNGRRMPRMAAGLLVPSEWPPAKAPAASSEAGARGPPTVPATILAPGEGEDEVAATLMRE